MGNRTRIPDMHATWRARAEAKGAQAEAQRVIERWDGLKITIRRSKTDQEGHGETIAIVRGGGMSCPVKAVKAWLQAAAIAEGAVFRPVAKGARLGA
jgi:hypothetical protein